MVEPKRWLTDDGAPDAALELLRAIDVPAPPSVIKQGELVRDLAALAGSGGATGAGGIALWAKLAMVCGAVIGGGALWVMALRPLPPAPPSPAASPAASSSHARAVSEAPITPPTAPASPAGAELRASSEAPATPPPAAHPSRSSRGKGAPRDALGEEEILLERARQLSSTEPAAAWRLLRQHRQRFPDGQLAAERLFLSVEVLERLGNAEGASVQAEALRRRFPSSVYAARVGTRRKAP